MLKIAVNGLDGVARVIKNLEKQTRFATAKALTKTAQKVQTQLVREMQDKFDRPTPYTLRSTFIKPATKGNLTATVGLKDRAGAKASLPPAELLAHHFTGSGRAMKGLERYLQRAGLISAGEFVVPGAGARLDQYGNMSRGQVAQLMGQLRIGIDPHQYASKSARSRRNVSKAGRVFWSRGGHLARGAWIDMGNPIGVRPLLVVVKGARYQRRIIIEQIAREVVGKEWDATFDAALADAMRTSR